MLLSERKKYIQVDRPIDDLVASDEPETRPAETRTDMRLIRSQDQIRVPGATNAA